MSSRAKVPVYQYACVSHGCTLWIGRELTREELTALSRAHVLAHRHHITPADLFGDQENPQ